MDDPRPSPSATVRRYATRLRARGPREVMSEWSGAVSSRIRSQGTLRFLTRSAADEVAPSSEPGGLPIRPASAADAELYARDVGTDSPRTFIDRLGPRTHCYLALDEERIVHASWVTSSGAWIGEIARYFVVPAGALYIYESFTRPDLRGRGIYPRVLSSIAATAAEEGRSELWIGVGATNAPSVRAIDKAGFEPAFDISFIRSWGRVTIDEVSGPRRYEVDSIIREGWPDDPMVQ